MVIGVSYVLSYVIFLPGDLCLEFLKFRKSSISGFSQDTTTTIKSMMDRFDALTQVVQNLANKISEIDTNANKRSRSPDTTVPQHEKQHENSSKGTRSPPAKLPRPMAPTPPSTPHPSNVAGARGAK
jgi:hypothetical protein